MRYSFGFGRRYHQHHNHHRPFQCLPSMTAASFRHSGGGSVTAAVVVAAGGCCAATVLLALESLPQPQDTNSNTTGINPSRLQLSCSDRDETSSGTPKLPNNYHDPFTRGNGSIPFYKFWCGVISRRPEEQGRWWWWSSSLSASSSFQHQPPGFVPWRWQTVQCEGAIHRASSSSTTATTRNSFMTTSSTTVRPTSHETIATEASAVKHPPMITISTASDNTLKSNNTQAQLIFLGTGSSTGCPRPLCALAFPPSLSKQYPGWSFFGSTETMTSDDENSNNHINNNGNNNDTALQRMRYDLQYRSPGSCRTSVHAIWDHADPRFNKNYRNNPCLMIVVPHPNNNNNDDDSVDDTNKMTDYFNESVVVIDVGKTFREAALRWMPAASITHLDAIVLTHHHMDAAAGLDDIRGFQHWTTTTAEGGTTTAKLDPFHRTAPAMPLFLSEHCRDDLQDRFPWLLPKHRRRKKPYDQPGNVNAASTTTSTTPPTTSSVERHVATFDVNVLESFQPVQVAPGLIMTPLPVLHGEDLVSFGYAFTVAGCNIVYLSDISRMPSETASFIQQQLPPTDILIVDALLPHQDHAVHYSLQQAMDLTMNVVQPRRQVWFIGMNCDAFPPHDATNLFLEQEYGMNNQDLPYTVQLAHDGLILTITSPPPQPSLSK